MEQTQGAARGELRNTIGSGDEDGLAGEGQRQVGEGGLEGLGSQRCEANEKATGLRGGGFCGAGDVGVGCGHRAVLAFLGFMVRDGSNVG